MPSLIDQRKLYALLQGLTDYEFSLDGLSQLACFRDGNSDVLAEWDQWWQAQNRAGCLKAIASSSDRVWNKEVNRRSASGFVVPIACRSIAGYLRKSDQSDWKRGSVHLNGPHFLVRH